MIRKKDELINKELRAKGYEIIRIWHSEFKENPEKYLKKIQDSIKSH